MPKKSVIVSSSTGAEGLARVRTAIQRFHDLAFHVYETGSALQFVRQQIETALELREPTEAANQRFEIDLPVAAEFAFRSMAEKQRTTVEEVIDQQRPAPGWHWSPSWRTDPEQHPERACDAVLFMSLLHDSVGTYRNLPLKPRWKPEQSREDFCWDFLWSLRLDRLPKPEDDPTEWGPPEWFEAAIVPKVGGWLRVSESAMREAGFSLPDTVDPVDDGPFGIDQFRWRGGEYKLIGGIPFALLRAAWTAKNRTLEKEEIAEAHGDRNEMPDWGAVKRNYGRMNEQFERQGLRFRFSGESKAQRLVLKNALE
jgi:hypothetical protein